jgi:hypothetical protein
VSYTLIFSENVTSFSVSTLENTTRIKQRFEMQTDFYISLSYDLLLNVYIDMGCTVIYCLLRCKFILLGKTGLVFKWKISRAFYSSISNGI